MLKLESGILDRTRLIANILMLALVAGNIFFSIQYIQGIKDAANSPVDNTPVRIQTARFLKLFVDVVLNTKEEISFENRVKLENDVRQLGDADIIKEWNVFVNSKDATIAQASAVKLMSMLANKMIP
jgi:hypothetical protein